MASMAACWNTVTCAGGVGGGSAFNGASLLSGERAGHIPSRSDVQGDGKCTE